MDISLIILKTVLAFSVLFITARFLGKKQISQLTFFNYVTGIAIGSVAASWSIDKSIPFAEGFTALAVWGILTIIMAYISLKVPQTKAVLEGEPTLVIKDGKIQKEAMTSLRLSMDDLKMLLREQGIFSIKEVRHAIMETNGKLSVFKKPEALYMPIEVIVDGNVLYKNLNELNIDSKWLTNQLKTRGLDSPKDVLYAELQEDGSLHIDTQYEKEVLH